MILLIVFAGLKVGHEALWLELKRGVKVMFVAIMTLPEARNYLACNRVQFRLKFNPVGGDFRLSGTQYGFCWLSYFINRSV